MDKNEVIDLCGESQTTTSDHWKAKQNKKLENHDMEESKTVTRKVNKNKPEKDFQAQETIRDEVAIMCWENSEVLEEKPCKERSRQDERPDDDKEKPNYDKTQEEHVNCTLDTGNQQNILIEEFSSEMEMTHQCLLPKKLPRRN